MSAALATFIGSALAMILMIALKAFQERAGVLIFWPHARNRLESRLQRKVRKAEQKISAFTHRHVNRFLHFILLKARGVVVRVLRRIDRKANQLMGVMSGKESLHMRQAASHIFHDITHFRKTPRK